MRRLIALLLALAGPVSAQDGDPPIPVRDVYALAQRLTGVSVTPPPPLRHERPPRAIGERQVFRVLNLGDRTAANVSATLRAVGDHVYVWVEDGVAAADAHLQRWVERLDDDYFPAVQALWTLPDPTAPDIDGEVPVHLLFHRDPAGGYGGYFSSEHLHPRAISPNSSEHELLIMNARLIEEALSVDAAAQIAAHEYQHLLRYQAGGAAVHWLNEGFSTYTDYRLSGSSAITAHFYSAPGTALMRWESGSAAAYGAALDWLLYLEERCGPGTVPALARRMNGGQRDVNAALAAALADLSDCSLRTDADLTLEETVFADWIAARARRFNAVDLSDSEALDVALTVGGSGVFRLAGTAVPTTVRLSADAYLSVLPAPVSGPIWRTQRADLQMSELVLADLDLTAARRAQFDYRIWYDIEPGFDHGYVLVDDGSRVTIVTPVTDADDPYGSAYGPAYTGRSEGWRDQQIDLTPFVGGRARIAFLYVTDDGVQHPGIGLSDLRVTVDDVVVFDETMTPLAARGWVYRPPLLENRLLAQMIDQESGALLTRRVLGAVDLRAGSVELPVPAVHTGVILTISPLNMALEVPIDIALSLSSAF